jgi:ABC-type multidrug transport system ATPase subunit
MEPVVKMRGLTKTFKRGKKALKGISLDIHKGSILGLLGHNGAGKSTTISILTGLIEKSEGSATVYDTDIFEEMGDVREFMGVCP